jgi:hypothetical protein
MNRLSPVAWMVRLMSSGDIAEALRCGDKGSAEVGVSVTDKDSKNFAKYPIRQSGSSVAKHIGNAVHNFFHHL